MQNIRYKLVALDLDGTLLNSHGQLTEKHIEAVRKAQNAGVHVVIATGRYYMQTERIIKALDFDGLLVSNDGSVTIKNKTKKRIIMIGLSLIYILFVVKTLFLDNRILNGYYLRGYNYNLIPFKTIATYITRYNDYNFNTWFNNLFGNIILFIPFGFSTLYFSRKLRYFKGFVFFYTGYYCHSRGVTNAFARWQLRY